MLNVQQTPEICPPPPEEKTGFSFDELSDSAKDHARDDYRENGLHYDWWDFVYEDADTIASLMGIDIDRRTTKRGTRQHAELAIQFSGFWSQGDGACFEGSWSPAPDCLKKVKAHASKDETLHKIAASLAELSARPKRKKVSAQVTHTGHYCHAYSTTVSVSIEDDEDLSELQTMAASAIDRANGMDTFEKDLTEALRDFMNWIYDQLEQEYDHLTSDESVDEALETYTFDEDGDLI